MQFYLLNCYIQVSERFTYLMNLFMEMDTDDGTSDTDYESDVDDDIP